MDSEKGGVSLKNVLLTIQNNMAQMQNDMAQMKESMATKSDMQGIKKKIKKLKIESQQTNSRMNKLEDLQAYAPFRGNAPPEINRAPSGSGFLEPRSTWRRELPFRK